MGIMPLKRVLAAIAICCLLATSCSAEDIEAISSKARTKSRPSPSPYPIHHQHQADPTIAEDSRAGGKHDSSDQTVLLSCRKPRLDFAKWKLTIIARRCEYVTFPEPSLTSLSFRGKRGDRKNFIACHLLGVCFSYSTLLFFLQLQQQQQQLQQQQQQHQLILGPPPTSSSSSSSTSTSTSTSTTSTAPPSASPANGRHPLVQLLGPLARDHQGQYKPYYQSDAASAPLAGPGAPLIHQPYLQIPTSLLMAAAQQLQQHHQLQQQQQQQQQAVYAKVAAPPAPPAPPSYQPAQLIYQPQAQAHHHQPQIQLQLQRIFLQPPQPQQSTIYAEQPAPLYAYPLQQQHHQQYQKPHQQQPLKQAHQSQQQHKYTPAAPTSPTALTTSTTSTAATSAAAATAAATGTPQAAAAAAAIATRQQHLPLVHYNPIYVQAPAEQQHQQQHQFAILPRFSNGNPKAVYSLAHESAGAGPGTGIGAGAGAGAAAGPIHVVRLSAANGPPIHHYHHYQPAPMLQPLYGHAPQQYVSSYAAGDEVQGPKSQVPVSGSGSSSGSLLAGPTPSPLMTAASPAIIPYFSHPGAVHYGTHLYHPGAATALGATASATSAVASAAAASAAGPRAAGPKQQSTATSGGQLPGDSNNIVKYP
ncbi:GD24879 [Drosophila simulans]|uniref:GD24879 n=1 Tax=Drosophila simulans TaxID=7240 RepID=B4NUS6_DROSI|nr:GD24879 [Drosophila simulans]